MESEIKSQKELDNGGHSGYVGHGGNGGHGGHLKQEKLVLQNVGQPAKEEIFYRSWEEEDSWVVIDLKIVKK